MLADLNALLISEDVQQAAMHALHQLVYFGCGADNAARAVAAGGVTAALNAMIAHPKSSAVRAMRPPPLLPP